MTVRELMRLLLFEDMNAQVYLQVSHDTGFIETNEITDCDASIRDGKEVVVIRGQGTDWDDF